MCKILINEVLLGKRTVGFEMYETSTKEIIGLTERQVRDILKEGKPIYGFKLEKDKVVFDKEFGKTYMVKTGIGTLKPKDETDSIVNLIYTVVGKVGQEFEVVNSRFGRSQMKEEKVKMLYELGGINGITIDEKGKVQLFGRKEEAKKSRSDKASS